MLLARMNDKLEKPSRIQLYQKKTIESYSLHMAKKPLKTDSMYVFIDLLSRN